MKVFFTYKSQDFAQSQDIFAWSHDHETMTFRNYGSNHDIAMIECSPENCNEYLCTTAQGFVLHCSVIRYCRHCTTMCVRNKGLWSSNGSLGRLTQWWYGMTQHSLTLWAHIMVIVPLTLHYYKWQWGWKVSFHIFSFLVRFYWKLGINVLSWISFFLWNTKVKLDIIFNYAKWKSKQ